MIPALPAKLTSDHDTFGSSPAARPGLGTATTCAAIKVCAACANVSGLGFASVSGVQIGVRFPVATAIKQLLTVRRWEPHIDWIRAVVGGHHGTYPSRGDYRITYDARVVHGQHRWDQWRLTRSNGYCVNWRSFPPLGHCTICPTGRWFPQWGRKLFSRAW